MMNEVDTASTEIWQLAPIAGPTEGISALLRLLRISRRPLHAPRLQESKLPNGCAFAVRYSSR